MISNLFILFLTSFLAGSFVPMGSEVHLLYLQSLGESLWPLLLTASIGNTFGGMSCYYIARWGGPKLIKKYLRHDEYKIDAWVKRLSRHSEWGALFCWLPFVGEIIATALGIISSKTIKIFIFMFLGKFLRYLFISLSASALI